MKSSQVSVTINPCKDEEICNFFLHGNIVFLLVIHWRELALARQKYDVQCDVTFQKFITCSGAASNSFV